MGLCRVAAVVNASMKDKILQGQNSLSRQETVIVSLNAGPWH